MGAGQGRAGSGPNRARTLSSTQAGVPAELEEGDRGPGGARGRGQGSRRSSRWARAEAGREDDPRRVLQRCEMQHHHPWETGKASLASVKNSQSEQRRAGRTGSTGTVPAPQPAPAGLESPEGNRVQQEMKNGNAVCHAQGNNKKPAIVASQRPASHPELTGPDC